MKVSAREEETLPLGSETEIEQWIKAKGQLCGERLLVLCSQRPIKRMVDLLALDGAGRLVFIEIKNEVSDRMVVGQVLEYLWTYREAVLEDLEEEFSDANPSERRSLAEAYQSTFGKPLQLQQQLRFIIIAPGFNVNTTFGIRSLRDIAKLDCALVTVSRQRKGFGFAPYELPVYQQAGSLTPGSFAMSRSRVVCVLAGGRTPILWTVGRLRSDGSIRLMGQPTLSKRAAQAKRRTVIPIPHPTTVSLDQSGSVYFRPRRSRWAVLVGTVEGTKKAAGRTPERYCVCAVLHDGRLEGFKAYEEQLFHSEWQLRTRNDVFPWRELLSGEVIPVKLSA